MTLATSLHRRYSALVAANSAIRLGGLNIEGGHNRPTAVFYRPQHGSSFMSGPCGVRLRTLAPSTSPPTCTVPLSLLGGRGSEKYPTIEGVIAMTTPAINPSAVSLSRFRANWHRRMALACLRADSSKAVRLTRYRAHIEKARALEVVGGVK